MQVGLIGAGTWRARSRAAGASPCSCTDALPEPRRGAGRRARAARRWPPTPRSPSAPTLVVLCHKPAPARARWPPRSAPRARAVVSILAATPLADRQGGLPRPRRPTACCRARPSRCARARRAGPRRRAGRRRSTAAVRDALRRARDARRPRRRARRPGDGAHELRARLRRARRRGPGRRRRARRAARRRRAELVVQTLAGTAELLRAGTTTRWRCAAQVTSPGGATARGLAALERGGVRAAFSDALDAALADLTPGRRDPRPRHGARPDRELRLGGALRLHAADHRLHPDARSSSASAGACPTRAGRARSSGSCATSASRTWPIFRRFIPAIGPLDFSPIVAILVLQIVGGIVVGLIRG